MTNCACGKTLSSQNKSGMCRLCHNHWLNTDPDVIARRKAGQRAFFETPGVKEMLRDRALELMANLSPEEIERRREHGREQHRKHLSRPDVRAHTLSPEVRAKAGKSVSEARLAHIPPSLRPEYLSLRSKGLTAAEREQAVLSKAHREARQEVERRFREQACADRRQKAQAY